MTDTCIECMILKDNKKNSSRDFYPKNLEIQIICGIQVNIILKNWSIANTKILFDELFK